MHNIILHTALNFLCFPQQSCYIFQQIAFSQGRKYSHFFLFTKKLFNSIQFKFITKIHTAERKSSNFQWKITNSDISWSSTIGVSSRTVIIIYSEPFYVARLKYVFTMFDTIIILFPFLSINWIEFISCDFFRKSSYERHFNGNQFYFYRNGERKRVVGSRLP